MGVSASAASISPFSVKINFILIHLESYGDTAHVLLQMYGTPYTCCMFQNVLIPRRSDVVHKTLCTQTHTHLPIHTHTHTHTHSLRSCGLVCVSNNLSVPRSRGNQLECEIENKQSFQIVKPLRQPASPSLFEAHRLSSDHIQIYSIAHVP